MEIDPEARVAKLVHDIYEKLEKTEIELEKEKTKHAKATKKITELKNNAELKRQNDELRKVCNSLRTQNSELIDECEYLEKRIERNNADATLNEIQKEIGKLDPYCWYDTGYLRGVLAEIDRMITHGRKG